MQKISQKYLNHFVFRKKDLFLENLSYTSIRSICEMKNMPIHFHPDRWKQIREDYDLWWNRKLDRPIIKMPIFDAYQPIGKLPKAPLLCQANCHDFQYTPEQIIQTIDYELSKIEFLGVSFPIVNFDVFGPGITSAFCGAKLDNHSGSVWFFPKEKKPIEEIQIKYNPDNQWVERIKSIYLAGQKKWEDQVLMSMPDLGGVLDIVAVFRETENLLIDLYDTPEEVLRLCDEAYTAWMEAYHDLNSVLQPINPGYSDWGAFIVINLPISYNLIFPI